MAPSIKKRVGEKNDQVVACRIRLYIKKMTKWSQVELGKGERGRKEKINVEFGEFGEEM